MDMLRAAGEALFVILDVYHLAMLLLGIGVGLLVGILPGLGGVVGMALLLPFLWGMEPSAALALLMGMMAVLRTVDTIPAVLFAVPGTAGSQATIMDGYPMAKKGQSARALGAAFTASMIGGVFGAFALSYGFDDRRCFRRLCPECLITHRTSPSFFIGLT
jgi:TctA family transporter